MSAECNRCGACCQNIPAAPRAELHAGVARRSGSSEYSPHSVLLTVAFIEKHWKKVGELPDDKQWMYQCDMFDPETNLCTAHDDRPPICSGYPWYGDRRPRTVEWANTLPITCSYRADVPEADQPVVFRGTMSSMHKEVSAS